MYSIALRFTEKIAPEVGTIKAHQELIDINGYVWYGKMGNCVSDANIVGIETHILDYNGDLYGKFVKVTFVSFLRPEMKFNSIDELKAQMSKDKTIAKDFFNKR